MHSDPLGPMREARAQAFSLPPLSLTEELLLSSAGAIAAVGGLLLVLAVLVL